MRPELGWIWKGLEGDSLVLTVEVLLGNAVQPLDSKAQTDVSFRPVLISTNSISSLKGPRESGRSEKATLVRPTWDLPLAFFPSPDFYP